MKLKYNIAKPHKTLNDHTAHLRQLLEERYKNPHHQNMAEWEDVRYSDPRIKNNILRTLSPSEDYKKYIWMTQLLVKMGADPNVCFVLPLALHHNDTNFARFLLDYKADPNYISQEIHSDICHHQENGSHALINPYVDVPAFYFAKDRYSAELCRVYGANPHLPYCKHGEKPEFGNILTYIIENRNYPTELIPFYIACGAGAYCKSHTSNGGSALHSVMHVLNESTQNTDAQRSLKCAAYLVEAEPDLINAQDMDKKTPDYYLDRCMENIPTDIFKDFKQLFASAHVSKKARE